MRNGAETRIHLCGRFSVKIDGTPVARLLPGAQGRLLFAFLVLARHRIVSRDDLIEAIWDGAPPSAPEVALSALLSKIRRAVGTEVLAARGEPTITLPAGAFVDVEVAREAAHRGEAALSTGDLDAAYGAGRVAVYIAERGFMPGSDLAWARELRDELEAIQVRGHECCARVALGHGGTELWLAERHARDATRVAPYRESAYSLLIEARTALGNHAQALQAFDEIRCRLRDDLAIAPGPELQQLHEDLINRPSLL